MTMKDNLQIANTILSQMKACVIPARPGMRAISGVQGMMCWGYRAPAVIESGLQFKVNARKLRNGTVKIVLDQGADLYNLEFLNVRGRVMWTAPGIYCDELASIIDSFIESD